MHLQHQNPLKCTKTPKNPTFTSFGTKLTLICYLWIKVVRKTLVPTRENSLYTVAFTVCNRNKKQATVKMWNWKLLRCRCCNQHMVTKRLSCGRTSVIQQLRPSFPEVSPRSSATRGPRPPAQAWNSYSRNMEHSGITLFGKNYYSPC